MKKETEGNSNPFAWLYPPIAIVLLIGGAFWIGRLSARIDVLENGSGTVKAEADQAKPSAAESPSPTSDPLEVEKLKVMAKDLGLETNKFNSCLDEGKYEKKIKDDLAYGGELGVDGTPTFFINGIMVVGALPLSQFEKIIDAELKDGTGEKAASTNGGKVSRVKIENGVGYVRGKNDAEVKLIEFSDFQCPYCERVEPVLEALEQKYGDKLSLEYRHNPLPFHNSAQKAAEGSECAGEQGKFWEMHDAIFEATAQG